MYSCFQGAGAQGCEGLWVNRCRGGMVEGWQDMGAHGERA